MSEIRATTISDAAGTGPITLTGQSAAKVWAVTKQTGTMTLLDSLNIGSITDTNVGRTTYNFATSFLSVNYSACYSSSNDNNFVGEETGRSASSILLSTNQHDGTKEDANHQNMQAHGDLA